MSYFDDLQFVGGGHDPDCRHPHVARRFDSFYSLQFDRTGTIEFAINQGETSVLPSPVIYLLHPDNHYSYGPARGTERWSHGWVAFRGPRGRAIFEQGFMPLAPQGYLRLDRDGEAAGLWDAMVAALPRPEAHHRAVLCLENLLGLLLDRRHRSPAAEGASAIFPRLAAEMQAYPFRRWNTAQTARSLHLSASHFRRRFREALGRPPHDYLLHCRMQKVAAALQQGGRSIKAVAAHYGYTDLAVFSRLFKKQIGVSPRQYREAAQPR